MSNRRRLIHVRSALAGLILTASGQAALAASFQCSLAKTFVEQAICADPMLSAEDEQIARRWKDARVSGDAGDVLLNEQRMWLRERNSCTTVQCLHATYIRRISQLGQIGEETSIGLPGSVAGEICGRANVCKVVDETPAFVVSQDNHSRVKIRIGNEFFTSGLSSVSVVYKGCNLTLRSYDLHSFCPGMK